MEISSVDFKSSGLFSKLFLDFVSHENQLEKFTNGFISIEFIKKSITSFPFDYLNRKVLVEALEKQNAFNGVSEKTKKNILALSSENTFTVTTGHQLCLFTGPSYFIYKIISCLKTCELLNKEIPGKHFVPVYWMATEDHDLEEINHAFVYGKRLNWEIKGKGRSGELSTNGIERTIDELKNILGDSENSKEILLLFEKAYLQNKTLAEATRYLVNELFGKFGLVILDGNSSTLKRLFAEEMKNDVLKNTAYKNVSASSEELKALGYETQVFPREINLFYAEKNVRERIEKKDGIFTVLNTGKKFSEHEILTSIENTPENFSPNVVLRPLYQQKILPNIIYCGGPGEIAYWLQYKSFFDESKIHFPFLLPRNFVLLLDRNSAEKWKALGFSAEELFEEEEETLIKKFVKMQSGEISLENEKKKLVEIFGTIEALAQETDKSLVQFAAAEKQKALNSISVMESKLNKALKQKNETGINQIASIRAKVFPAGVLQERHENFFSFANKYGLKLLDEIMKTVPQPVSNSSISIFSPENKN